MIKAATRRLEELTDRKFITQVWEVFADSFPTRYRGGSDDWWDGVRDGAISEMTSASPTFNLPFGRLQEVVKFATYTDAGTEFIFDPSEYVVDTVNPWGRVSLSEGSVWPSTTLRRTNGIMIEGKFGFGDTANDVPEDLRLAILQFVAKMFEHRGDELPKVPAEVALLCEPYRKVKVGC